MKIVALIQSRHTSWPNKFSQIIRNRFCICFFPYFTRFNSLAPHGPFASFVLTDGRTDAFTEHAENGV